jgi:anti-sigma factor (TIGR02949 family)
MDCKQALARLPAHLDRELGESDAREMDQHLHACPACQREFVRQMTLRNAVRQHASYFAAPAGLESRILSALPGAHDTQREPASPRWYQGAWNWLNVGSVLASLLVLAWSAGLYLATPTSNALLAEEVMSSHVRSLMVNHLADVASTDQHTVKPWFDGKLDFAPVVNDFAAQGFPLIGGRLDYLDQRAVAALVYRHRLHLINVYSWPAAKPGQTAPQTLSIRGYHLVHWREAGMVYWMVSDLDERDLLVLADRLQKAAQVPPP